jgi:hypothetical protein
MTGTVVDGAREVLERVRGVLARRTAGMSRHAIVTTATRWALVGAAVAGLLFLIGTLAPDRRDMAVAGAIGVLVVGLSLNQPAALPILAMPALVIVDRVGGEGTNLSISDFVLFAAFWAAVLLTPRPFSPPMRSILWLSVVYQVATLFTVVTNVYTANTIEWFHAWLSVAGALVVGWAVGRAGFGRLGLSLFLAACAVIAVLTCIQAVVQLTQGNTGPVYLETPYGMHKNFIGTVLGFAAVVAYARPSWVGWTRRWAMAGFVLFTLAVLASQARQALVGLGVALVVIALRKDPDRKRSKVILLGVAPAAFFVASLVQEQLEEGNEFNSTYQRLTWYEQSLQVWDSSPWFGVGLRWWTAGRTEFLFQPPNAELEVITSAGIVGLTGFVILFVGVLGVLWKVDPRYGTLAFTIVLTRLVQGQFDLFWSAVVVSIPFAIAGLCLGAQAAQALEQPPDDASRVGGDAGRAVAGPPDRVRDALRTASIR